jgi:hypothetical protein
MTVWVGSQPRRLNHRIQSAVPDACGFGGLDTIELRSLLNEKMIFSDFFVLSMPMADAW